MRLGSLAEAARLAISSNIFTFSSGFRGNTTQRASSNASRDTSPCEEERERGKRLEMAGKKGKEREMEEQ